MEQGRGELTGVWMDERERERQREREREGEREKEREKGWRQDQAG